MVLTVAYDGRPYHGFVAQPGQPTVAGKLLDAIRTFDDGVDKLVVASRTDSGVHARTQLTAFDTTRSMPMRAWVLGVQQRLPDSIAVRAATRREAGYNPRFMTAGKRYRYLVLCDQLVDPLWAGRAWRVRELENTRDAAATIRAELQQAMGEHDFAAFASAHDPRSHTRRTLTKLDARVFAEDERVMAIDVEGDGFLHNMVRILIGTAVDVARRRLPAGAITRALETLQREHGGITAPPQGLYLEQIDLREPLGDDRWPA